MFHREVSRALATKSCVLVVSLLLQVACGHPDEQQAIIVPVRRPDPIAPGLTHGAAITTVAVTENGDAALTVDGLGEVRLWPSLDGKRPPVPVGVVGVERIALGHAGDDLLAAFLSEAGDVQLVKLGHDGSVHGRAQLPGDIACEQVIAIDDGVLVVRADQSIERFDADAKLRGRVVAAPRERIAAIATRRGGAVALIQHEITDGEAELARHLVIDKGLHWGTSIALPWPVAASALALSPSGRRIAVVNRRASEVQVLDLATRAPVGQGVHLFNLDVLLGFTDDAHVAVMTPTPSELRWWREPSSSPPDATIEVPGRPTYGEQNIAGGAVGDGVAVGGRGASLLLAGPAAIHYLGWNLPAVGTLRTVDAQIMLVWDDRAAWFDGRLAVSGDREIIPGPDRPLWIEPRHVVVYRSETTPGKTGRFELVDLDQEKRVPIASGQANSVFYEPTIHLLALYRAPSQKAERYALDLEHLAVQTLAPLEISPEFPTEGGEDIELLDPARAGGVIALARWCSHRIHQCDITRVAIYRAPGAEARVIRPSRELVFAEVLAVDATGAIYARDTPDGPIIAHRDGRPDVKLAGVVATGLVPSHDGKLLAAVHDNELSIVDATGMKRWRRALWGLTQVVFSSDDRYVIVKSDGGLVSFDATTGTRLAAACAFDFGLHDQPTPTNTLNAAPVCEAPPL